ncbi:hypothetical protein IFM89_031713 [Coptis chinensis]|uniref:Protein LOW PSII ACCUMULATION 2, chloroplastic n=1 Tax=Coptis chinensis TaxID=261450 RepID=A0A835IF66_9MAGN|nr:hypothetical protein IFM89_031713 [Coptis chinensis]
MALRIQYSCSMNKPISSLFNFPPKTRLTIKATNTSPTEEPTQENSSSVQTKKPSVGFGSTVQSKDGKKKKISGERAAIIRRTPLQKPDFLTKKKETQVPEPNSYETAFLLTWLGLGSLIIIEGLALAASGLFPEEWDKFFVKYLYPSFTPTVFLFVAGTVVYGVLKYLEGEKTKS